MSWALRTHCKNPVYSKHTAIMIMMIITIPSQLDVMYYSHTHKVSQQHSQKILRELHHKRRKKKNQNKAAFFPIPSNWRREVKDCFWWLLQKKKTTGQEQWQAEKKQYWIGFFFFQFKCIYRESSAMSPLQCLPYTLLFNFDVVQV